MIAFAFMSLGMGLMFGSTPFLWALFTSFVLGTTYSIDLPFLRWKRSALAVASCILCVRVVVVQISFYLHIQSSVYRRPAILTKPLVFAIAFMCFFSIMIALFKDLLCFLEKRCWIIVVFWVDTMTDGHREPNLVDYLLQQASNTEAFIEVTKEG